MEVGRHQACLEVEFAPKLQFLKKLKDAFDHRLHRAGRTFYLNTSPLSFLSGEGGCAGNTIGKRD